MKTFTLAMVVLCYTYSLVPEGWSTLDVKWLQTLTLAGGKK